MNVIIDPATKAARIGDLFVVEPTFKSKSGTGRRCHTIQGWHLRMAEGAPIRLLFNQDREEWFSARKDGIARCEDWHRNAHEGNVEEMARKRKDYLRWLVQVWPEAPAARQALAMAEETERKALEANRQEQQTFKQNVERANACVALCAGHDDLSTVAVVPKAGIEAVVSALLEVLHDGPRLTETQGRIHVEKARQALEALGTEHVRQHMIARRSA